LPLGYPAPICRDPRLYVAIPRYLTRHPGYCPGYPASPPPHGGLLSLGGRSHSALGGSRLTSRNSGFPRPHHLWAPVCVSGWLVVWQRVGGVHLNLQHDAALGSAHPVTGAPLKSPETHRRQNASRGDVPRHLTWRRDVIPNHGVSRGRVTRPPFLRGARREPAPCPCRPGTREPPRRQRNVGRAGQVHLSSDVSRRVRHHRRCSTEFP
jgi:hypothetical protein